jgi:uncharacterized protein (TIGR02680 family)
MNRWAINKYGFINFWLFDKEEIRTYGGNLLLTGENGSGKSVILQSFIPLIFDGNTSSRRLSTEGDNSRQIEYYLLYGDKKEAISYIYAEFQREDDNGNNEYISLIIGMKLRQGQGTPKKWFVISKGKRVGKDFDLFINHKEYLEPYDKGDLKKKLENLDIDFEFYDNASDYKQAVNKNLFGFKSIDEFEETIDLIVELRQPNLRDNTGFDPKYIYEILNKSLKVISEKDLKSISDTFEKIEEISEELKNEELQYKTLSKIEEQYVNYKKIILAQGLKEFKEKFEAYTKNIEDIKKNKEGLEKVEESIKKINERMAKLELEKIQKENERSQIQDTTKGLAEKKESRQRELNIIEANLKKIEENIQKLKGDIKKYSEEKIRKANQYDNAEKEYLSLEGMIKELQEKIGFSTELNYLKLLSDKKDNAFTSANFNFENHKKRLEKLFVLLDENKLYQEKINTLKSTINKEEVEALRVEGLIKDIKKKNVENINEFSKTLSDRREKILSFNYGDIKNICEILDDFDENDFKDEIQKNKAYLTEEINKEINEYRRHINNLKDEIQSIIEEKKMLEQEEDIKIELLSHKVVERKDHKHIKAFYELIKFREGLNKDLEGKIEKALWEMGLLDSLVTDDNSIFDKLLTSTSKVENNLSQYLVVEEDCEYKNLVENILNSIGTKANGDIYITEDGLYKNLLITGKVDTWEGKYIGVEARKKLRLKKINELLKKLDLLEEREELLKENIANINKKLLLLQDEYNEIMNIFKDYFVELYDEFDKNTRTLNYLQGRIATTKDQLKKIEEIKEKIIKNLESESKKLGLEIHHFDVIKESLKAFEENFEKMQNKYEMFLNYYKAFKDYENMEFDLEARFSERSTERRKLLQSRDNIKEIILNIDREIEENGHSLLLKRIETLSQEIEAIPKKISEISFKLDSQNEKVNILNRELENALKASKEIEEAYNISNSLINEELNQTDHNIDNIYYYTDEAKIKLYEEYESYANQTSTRIFNEISGILSRNELILKVFGLKLDEYNYTETRENYELSNLRERYVLKAFIKGREASFQELINSLKERIGRSQEYLNAEEQKFFKEMLFGYINKEIASRIKESKSWTRRIDSIMKRAETNSGKRYSLKWTSKNVISGLQGDTLYDCILNINNPSKKGEESAEIVRSYFERKTKELKNNAQNENNPKSSYEILKEVLDYRNWYEFNMSVLELATGSNTNLTKRKLNSYSGGEKAMAMYIPLFSALYARFANASEISPMIITMDEAFSVVDDENIAKLFEILEDLNLNYLLASQKLSGTYDTVKKLAIVYIENMTARKNLSASEGFISLIKYLWNGVERKKDLRGDEGGQKLLF